MLKHQRHPRCDGCAHYRSLVEPKWRSCKTYADGRPPGRLCEVVDVALLELAPRCSIDVYLDMSKAILTGATVASVFVNERSSFPPTPSEFVMLLLEMHRLMFVKALPGIAGRFRTSTEQIAFGGSGQNRLQGERANNIASKLAALHECLGVAELNSFDAKDLARRSAIFLERFFRIHPFVDGNGRVGRRLVQFFVEANGKYGFEYGENSAKWRQRYVHALEYAHRHAADSHHHGKRAVNACYYLSAWMLERIEPLGDPTDLVEDLPEPA